MPTRLASIELNTFDHCDILESINVAGTSGAFKSDDGVLLKKEANNDYSVFFCPRARTKEYVIGVGITSIARRAFQGCENLVTMNIPEWVSSIGEEAFMDCTALANLTFENAPAGSGDVLEIGDSAFYGCFALNQLSLPEQLTKLGKYAFGDISGLDEVTLNTTYGEVDYSSSAFASYDNDTYVTTLNLGMYVPAFDISAVFGSTALEEITVAPGNANIAAQDGVLYDKNLTTILYFPNGKANLSGDGTFVIPETVTTISANVFNGKKFLKSITIGNNVSTIGNYAFANCENLEEIIFKNDAGAAELEIGKGAFSDCYKISELNLPTRLRVIGDEAFAHLPLLEEVVIPEGVTTIGKGAFLIYVQKTRSVNSEGVVTYTVDRNSYKTNLKSFHISSTVTSIGEIQEVDTSTGRWADYGNNSNTRFLNGNVSLFYSKAENLGGAVNPCNLLQEFTVAEGNANYASLNGVLCKKTDGNITEILLAPQSGTQTGTFEVPATVTKIADQAFYNSNFTAITFASGSQLSSVGANAFGAGRAVGGTSGQVTNGDNTVVTDGSSSIASVTFPAASVTSLFATFAGNTALTTVNVPYTVEELGSMTFNGCSNLSTGLTFEEGETDKPLLIQAYNDGYNIFGGSGITSLVLPERVNIGEYAFTNTTSLTSVTIPESVTEIGRNAFTGCTSLATVTFAGNSQLKTIGDCAFGGAKYNPSLGQISTSNSVKACTSLTTINLPSSLESIGVAAFYGNKLTSVTIPAGVKTISRDAFNTGSAAIAFAEGSQLESIANDAFRIKANITGLENCTKLTFIGDNAFYENTVITSITIPESVKTIGKNAFYGCSALTGVTFATYESGENAGKCSLESIGDTCFRNTALTSVTFPANASGKSLMLGSQIFQTTAKNATLTTLTFEGPVASLDHVLTSAFALTTINVQNETLKCESGMLKSSDGSCIYFVYDANAIVDEDGVLEIPEGVTSIGSYAFYNKATVKKVVLPVSLVEIGQYAFNNCANLVEVQVSDDSNLKTIGNQAFCKTKLASFDFTKTTKLETIGEYSFQSLTTFTSDVVLPDSLKNLGTRAFYGTKITKVKIPAGLLTVGSSVFATCTSLTEVELGEGLEILGANMFEGTGVTEVSIPDSIKLIGEKVFQGCASLTKATVNYSSLINADTGIVVGDSKTSYDGNYMFNGCSNLAEVIMGESPRYIAANMFAGSAIESIDLSNITSMGNSPLQYCEKLTEVKLSDSLTAICPNMFWNCTALESLIIPESVTAVEQNAFEGCSSLKELVLPNVESIAQNAFKGCSSLTSVDMYNVKTIGNNAFDGCTALEEVVLGSVTEIGENVFNGKALIKELNLITVKTLGKNALNGCEGLEILDLSNATDIGEGALQNCTNLSTVDLSSARSIGKNAFNGCAILEELELPNATAIGESAFAGCINLVSVEITKVKTIGAGAFQGCEKLAEVTVEKVKSIGANAFAGCGEIAGIYTSKVESFGDSAFEGCYNLTEVDLSVCDIVGARAFYGCAELAKVTLPKSLPSFGTDAFTGCEKISFVVPEGANYTVDNEQGIIADENGKLYLMFGNYEGELVLDGVREIGGGALGASKASKIVFTSDLEVMAGGALGGFAGEIDLSAVNQITTYGDNMFKDYAGTEIIVPDFVTSIAGTAFAGCTNLETVTLGEGITEIPAGLFNGLSNVEITINGTLTSVGEKAFYNNKKLTSIDLSQVPSIGKSAFYGCSNLTSVTLSADLTELADEVFNETGLHSIELPANLTKIGKWALRKTPLTSITFPENLESIGIMAFNQCSSLTNTEIVIPASVKTIGTSAFSSTNITGVTLKEGLQTLGDSVFSTNSLSGTIYIPTTLTSMGYGVFNGTAITGITFAERTNGTQLMCGEQIFKGCTALESVTLPGYLVCDLKYYEFEDGEGGIAEQMFSGCTGLKTVVLEEGIADIEEMAFDGCTSLASLVLPSTLVNIEDDYAFRKCNALKTIVIPAKISQDYGYVSGTAFKTAGLEQVFIEFTESEVTQRSYFEYEAGMFGSATVYWKGDWSYVDGVPTPNA